MLPNAGKRGEKPMSSATALIGYHHCKRHFHTMPDALVCPRRRRRARGVPATVEADKGYAALLRLRNGREWIRRHNHERVVPRQPELSEYPGCCHTDPLDASSGQPAAPLDAVGAATSYAPTDNTDATANMELSSGEFEDTCVTSDPVGCASAPVDASKPEALSLTPLHRIS
ncbi:hypothetical protein HPB51_008064 [Rhipicephalus microplus]|uniref:Uncharacterized protein n=1 Tax=Rhipicephalus microplus TaxID=6941 RepID=A0A9J6EFE4_RHIMP|nr:hypothetical protein HPB51_008064 [Rhipicephalus microplus]